jgi:hypothetical protein
MEYEIGDLVIDDLGRSIWVITAKGVAHPKGPSYDDFYWRLDFLYCTGSYLAPIEKTRYMSAKWAQKEFRCIS